MCVLILIVFSVVEVASNKQVDVVPAFISSLGSQLYDTTGDHSDYDFETIIVILQVCNWFMKLLHAHNIILSFYKELFSAPKLLCTCVN